jgi:hypothetical protein
MLFSLFSILLFTASTPYRFKVWGKGKAVIEDFYRFYEPWVEVRFSASIRTLCNTHLCVVFSITAFAPPQLIKVEGENIGQCFYPRTPCRPLRTTLLVCL